MYKHKKICVFCGSSAAVSRSFLDAARLMGELIAQRGGTTICGAGKIGLMGELTLGALSQGGNVIGVIPQFMVDNGWHNPQATELIVTPDMHTRKKQMIDIADAIVAMPGGVGTFEELMEVITWKQLELCNKPIVILNTDDYYTPMIAMLERAIEMKFMKPSHSSLWSVASTPEEVLIILENDDDNINVESKY